MSVDVSVIGDDEFLYRRIPVSMQWYENGTLLPEAYAPRKDEETGISLVRASHKSISEAARGPGKKGYYVAMLSVRDVREIALSVKFVPETPSGYDVSHVQIPELNAGNRRSDICLEFQRKLASLSMKRSVEGPFVSSE